MSVLGRQLAPTAAAELQRQGLFSDTSTHLQQLRFQFRSGMERSIDIGGLWHLAIRHLNVAVAGDPRVREVFKRRLELWCPFRLDELVINEIDAAEFERRIAEELRCIV